MKINKELISKRNFSFVIKANFSLAQSIYSLFQIKSELRSLSAFATPLASLVRLLSTTSSILLYHRSLSNTIEVLETPMHYLQVVQITKLANDLLYRCYVE